MPLVFETGTIVPGANTYADIATADAYHSDRGNATWGDATEAKKTAALLAATTYLDGKYRVHWRGERVQPFTQALEWPRLGVEITPRDSASLYRGYYYRYYPTNQIPAEIIAATCELALRALGGPLAADIKPSDRVVKDKTDILETQYVPDFVTTYQAVDQLVGRWLKSGSDAVRG